MNRIKKVVSYANIFLFFALCFFVCFDYCKLFTIAGRTFSLSFYISIIALPIFYISYFAFHRHDVDFIIKLLAATFFLLFIPSLGMSFVITPTVGAKFSAQPTTTVLSSAIKYAYDLALIPYFAFMLSHAKKKWLCRSIDIFLTAWIAFGIFQTAVFYVNKPFLWQIYDSIDVLKIMGSDSALFARIRHNYGTFRFYGFASEPASNCILICFLLAYLYWRIFRCKQKKMKLIFYWISAAFVLLFAVLTKSASVFAGLLIMAAFGLYILTKTKRITSLTTTVILISALTLAIVAIIIPQTRAIFVNNFLFKLFDRTNQSTQYRYSTTWNDFMIFIRSPIFGIGDDNQGYFYASNVSGTWMAASPEAQLAIQGKRGLLSGGAIVPSFISGFGIFGIIVLALVTRSFVIYAKNTNPKWNTLKPYLQTFAAILFCLGLATIGFHRNYFFLLFLASPLLGRFDEEGVPVYVRMTKPTEEYRKIRVTTIKI